MNADSKFSRRSLLASATASPIAFGANPTLSDPIAFANVDMPAPQDWGANGKGNNDDTDAWQKAIDAVRQNSAYPVAGRDNARAYVRAPAGTYVITRSLDFTTDGSLQGLGIRGDGQLQTVIQAELVEAFPALDMTGMSGAQLQDFQIRASATSQALCGILLAMDPRNRFHNHYPLLRNLLLEIDYDAPNACAGLIIAASDLAMLDNVMSDGPVGATMGWRLPALERNQVARAASHLTLPLTPNPSGNRHGYSGYPIRITSGTGKGQIRSIKEYNESSREVTIEPAWDTVPDISSHYEISLVRSKYRLAQSYYDQTNYWVRNCQFTGHKALVLTGGVAANFDDVYFATYREMDADKSIFFIEAQDKAESPGPMYIHARGIRTENQTHDPKCFVFTTAQPGVTLYVAGELDCVPLGDAASASGAILHNVGEGSYGSIKIDGHSPVVPMFAYTGDIGTLWSTLRADFPGSLTGSIGMALVDWGNAARDRPWVDFLCERARVAVSPKAAVIGNLALSFTDGVRIRPSKDEGAIPAAIPLSLDIPPRRAVSHQTTGYTSTLTYEVSGALLKGAARRMLRCEIGGKSLVSGNFSVTISPSGHSEKYGKQIIKTALKSSQIFILEFSISVTNQLVTASGKLIVGPETLPFCTEIQQGSSSGVSFIDGGEIAIAFESSSDSSVVVYGNSFFWA